MNDPVLRVVFCRSSAGREPVREWLMARGKAARKAIGADIKTAQFGWPLGMPLIRKLEPDLWEVRTRLGDRIARTVFTVAGDRMVLLHVFFKKSRKTPKEDLMIARKRKTRVRGERR